MALPGITCPEKFLVPLYFRPEQQGELAKLFQKDSVFEHLWDPWKAEAVKSISYEDSSLVKYMHSHFLALKSPIFATLKQNKEKFNEIIKQIFNGHCVYSGLMQETFVKTISTLDNDIMIITLKYYAILEEHKRLSQVKYEHLKTAIVLKTEIEKLSRRINELSSTLSFETCGGIKIQKLDPNNPQFSRCDKAVSDNIKQGFFKDSTYTTLKVCIAYKIENTQMLKTFEKKLKNSEGCVLKGLFMSISKKQIPTICIFGIQNNDYVKTQGILNYFRYSCKLPKEFMGRTRIEEFLRACEGFGNEVCAGTNSTLVKDEKKIASQTNSVFVLVLCRAIVPRNKNDPLLNQETQEYKITDFSMVFPEYILICTKEKNNFEIVPSKHFIIPCKLTDLNYSSQSSNKMPVESFYNHLTKAYDQSLIQRTKLRGEVQQHIDSFWTARYKKDVLIESIIQTKKKYIEKLKSDTDLLRKDLITIQRFTESLKQIRNVRLKTSL